MLNKVNYNLHTMKYPNRLLWLIILVLFFQINNLHSQPVKVGTTAASFLEISVGSAGIGMGGAYTAIAEDVSALYWNPARAAYLENIEAMFMYQPWIAGISFNYGGVVMPVEGVGVFGVSITMLNSGNMEETTMLYQEGTGVTFSASDLAIQFTYARKVTDFFSFGFTGKYISQNISTMNASALAVDLGVYVVTPFFERENGDIDGIQIGMSISNYGGKMKLEGDDTFIAVDPDLVNSGNNSRVPADYRMGEYNLPVTFRIGLAYDLFKNDTNRFTLAADAVHPNNFSEYVNAGAQYQLSLWDSFRLDLRGGYKTLFVKDNTQGLTLGVGLLVDFSATKFKFDYAFSQMNDLGNTNNFTISLLF
ncbi:MAG: PorV/PorQ family protein [Chlorobi bacterium]|nr:PorV/PorQ family protein [Chlorobiota bacterium]